MNEIMNTIFSWQSVEKFTDRQLPQEDLQQIIQAALHAPNGNSDDRCYFLVIQNREKLDELNNLVKDAFFRWNTDESTNEVILKNKRESSRSNYNFHHKSPTLVIVSNNREYVHAVADSAYAVQNIMLSAQSLGIASCLIHELNWLKDHSDIYGFAHELGMPKEHMICGCVALGYPDKNTKPASVSQDGLVKII